MFNLVTIAEEHSLKKEDVFFYYLKSEEQIFSKSYQNIIADAKKLAVYLSEQFELQSRIVLIYPPGLDFISSFLVCLYAGMIAVPAYPLQNRRHAYRLSSIIDSCDASIILGTQKVLDDLDEIDSLRSMSS